MFEGLSGGTSMGQVDRRGDGEQKEKAETLEAALAMLGGGVTHSQIARQLHRVLRYGVFQDRTVAYTVCEPDRRMCSGLTSGECLYIEEYQGWPRCPICFPK